MRTGTGPTSPAPAGTSRLRTYIVRPTVAEQARQALRNLATVLDSEGASLANIVHWSIAVVDGQALG